MCLLGKFAFIGFILGIHLAQHEEVRIGIENKEEKHEESKNMEAFYVAMTMCLSNGACLIHKHVTMWEDLIICERHSVAFLQKS